MYLFDLYVFHQYLQISAEKSRREEGTSLPSMHNPANYYNDDELLFEIMEKVELMRANYEQKRLLEADNKDLEIANRKLETYARLPAPKSAPPPEKVNIQFIFFYTSEVYDAYVRILVCNVCMVSYPADKY
jgi:hypothetical protein